MSTVFLFGAGASNGSLDCHPHCPPLGRDLFNELQKAGGIAASLDKELAALFQDFEKGMDEFFDQRGRDMDVFLRDMARYFAQFVPGPNSLYAKLIVTLGEASKESVFSTINYDLLIEIAANQLGLLVCYSDEQPLPERNLRVCKIHGSCNFLPVVPPDKFTGLKIVNTTQTGCLFNAPVRPGTPAQVIEFCKRDSFAPAMATYAPSKWTPFCSEIVERQRDCWLAEVGQADLVFVICAGLQERDSHIWKPLAESNGCLVYVDPHPEEF